jgi:hypothetical protein
MALISNSVLPKKNKETNYKKLILFSCALTQRGSNVKPVFTERDLLVPH